MLWMLSPVVCCPQQIRSLWSKDGNGAHNSNFPLNQSKMKLNFTASLLLFLSFLLFLLQHSSISYSSLKSWYHLIDTTFKWLPSPEFYLENINYYPHPHTNNLDHSYTSTCLILSSSLLISPPLVSDYSKSSWARLPDCSSLGWHSLSCHNSSRRQSISSKCPQNKVQVS